MNTETAKIALWGTIMGAAIAASALFLNDWLKRKWEKEKWITDKMEKAYLECLKLLSASRRVPFIHTGEQYLEESSYAGLMAAMPHVPAWMIMMQCYSSSESASEIEPIYSDVSDIVKSLKAHEREITAIEKEGQKANYVKEFGISKAIEDALPILRSCFKRELLNLRQGRLCKWWCDSSRSSKLL